uniref:Ribonuclease H-like domain-containing protein n=1 Tax=Tanacetum cinerariifolium TaxID=118510 RepID=A0A6L2NGI8_TANCI|nr:ribonuclease H-like domain-containing protein [Tanacetum cinerariifolium]
MEILFEPTSNKLMEALNDTLGKLKGKVVVDEVVILHPIDLKLLKLDVAPLAPKLRNNRTAHYDYLKHTQEETVTHREIVEHERSFNPLNTSLDYAYNAVPPPAADLYLSPKKDLSWTGLPEFADNTVTDYSRPAPPDGQNQISSASENGEPTDSILSKPAVKFVKAVDRPAERPTTNKAKTVKKPTIKYAEIKRVKRGTTGSQNNAYMRPPHRPIGHRPHGAPMRPPHKPHGPLMKPMRPNMNGIFPLLIENFPLVTQMFPLFVAAAQDMVKDVQASACWVWKPVKPNSASIILKRYDYVDVRGRSRKYTLFGEETNKITSLYQESLRIVHTTHGDGVTIIKRWHQDLHHDGVRNLATASGRGRLKEDLESSMWRRRRHNFKATPSRYMNTIELPEGNNVVPLRSETIRLVQNRCSFHGLWSEGPNQHLKDFLKLVDSLDLNGDNRERTRLHLFQFSLRDQAINWLERLQNSAMTSLCSNNIKDSLFLKRGLVLRTYSKKSLIMASISGSNSKSFMTMSIPLQDEPSINRPNDPRDFTKSVKAISLPQDVPSTSDRHLIKLKNQVQHLIEAHLAPKQPIQVNKITYSCEIYSGPHDTQYCMENPKQAFVDYTSSRTDETGRRGKCEFQYNRVQGSRGNSGSEEEFEEETEKEIEEEVEDGPEHFDTFPTMKELRLCLTRKSLKVLRKFHWTNLGGRSNQLLHVSSPLLSKPGGHGTNIAYLFLYVDDIVLIASFETLLQQIICSLHHELTMTDLGSLIYFTGISVKRDSSGIFLSQCKYAVEILERAHMLFLSSTTNLVAYSDADWAGCSTARRSTSSYCVFLGYNLISWSSKRQPTLSRSSAEAEYRDVANAIVETLWLRNLLRELHTPLSFATLV